MALYVSIFVLCGNIVFLCVEVEDTSGGLEVSYILVWY